MLYFYFKSVVISLGTRVYNIIKLEVALNRSRSPRISLIKKKDENARVLYRNIFNSLIFSDKFIEVERGIFKEFPLEFVISRVIRNNVDLEILNSIIIGDPPPSSSTT